MEGGFRLKDKGFGNKIVGFGKKGVKILGKLEIYNPPVRYPYNNNTSWSHAVNIYAVQ